MQRDALFLDSKQNFYVFFAIFFKRLLFSAYEHTIRTYYDKENRCVLWTPMQTRRVRDEKNNENTSPRTANFKIKSIFIGGNHEG